MEEVVVTTCGASSCCMFAGFPWLWWALSVVVTYVLGWLWYSKLFMKSWVTAEQIKCNCGADLAKDEKCTCEKMSVFPMIVQFLATALVGLAFFLLTGVSVWLAAIVALAALAWEKGAIFFRVWDCKRAFKLVWIEVGYYCVALLIFILTAAMVKCCGAACGGCC